MASVPSSPNATNQAMTLFGLAAPTPAQTDATVRATGSLHLLGSTFIPCSATLKSLGASC